MTFSRARVPSLVLVGTIIGAMAFSSAPAAMASPGQSVVPLGTGDAADLVAALVGDGTVVSNVSVTGSTDSLGTFSGMDATGFSEGVALTSGFLRDDDNAVTGPNLLTNHSGDRAEPGDADLDAIVDGFTEDATVLEFDFVPTTGTVSFEYVFGSEEYEEYVDQGFNDVFAFFVDGVNRATFEDADGVTQPVAIDTVNHLRNTDRFVGNFEPGDDGTFPHDTELDGFTTVLGFNAPVTPGTTSHIKLVIADRWDSVWDSAVLIRAGSFRSNTAPVADDIALTTPIDTPVGVTLSATDAEDDPLEFTVLTQPENGTLSGTGADLTFTPDPGFTGVTSFTYVANDGSLTSEPATVTIEVTDATTPTPTPTDTATPTETPSPTATATETAVPIPSVPSTPIPDGGLAATGAGDELPVLAGLGAVLVIAAGTILLLRARRRA